MSDAKHRMQSFGIGHLLGLAGGRVPVAKREPVAYLYNGVRLPKLPETGYAYGMIRYLQSTGSYVFHSSETPFIHFKNAFPLGYDSIIQTNATLYTFKLSEESWTWLSENNSNIIEVGSEVFWCNVDILKRSDSSVYLAGSEPVPVYE